jgi:polyhydroxyalkanoate synthesis repressor PhaR
MTKPDILIRRYNDRRLYDTSASRYVKLEDVARMVREGTEVRVVDARSGRDLTSMVLTQIIVDDARNRETALPLQLLRTLIRASDRATHDFVSWYLNNTFELYQKTQEALRTRLSEAKTAASSPLEFIRRLLPLPAEAAPSSSPAASDAEEVERLRRRVRKLESELAAQPRRKRPVHRRPPAKSSPSPGDLP